MNYLLEVCGDCNDADYAYRTQVISEQELSRVRDMLKSIRKVREVHTKFHPNSSKDYWDKLSYYSKVINDVYEEAEYDENWAFKYEGEGWLSEVDNSDITNFIEFHETYIPYGTSDLDDVHTLNSVKAYKLCDSSPICLL